MSRCAWVRIPDGKLFQPAIGTGTPSAQGGYGSFATVERGVQQLNVTVEVSEELVTGALNRALGADAVTKLVEAYEDGFVSYFHKLLIQYAEALRESLDSWAMEIIYHAVTVSHSIWHGNDRYLIECTVELVSEPTAIKIETEGKARDEFLATVDAETGKMIKEHYVRCKPFFLYEGSRAYIYKHSRLSVEWSPEQAEKDAGEIIGAALKGSDL